MNETYNLLAVYADYYYTPSVHGTIPRLINWYEDLTGVRMSTRTFKRHVAALEQAGKIKVVHSKRGNTYTLLDFDVIMPRYKSERTGPGNDRLGDDRLRQQGFFILRSSAKGVVDWYDDELEPWVTELEQGWLKQAWPRCFAS